MLRTDFMDYILSATLRSVYRTICVIIATILISSNIRNWIQMSLRISPILAILVVILVIYILGQLWKKYAADVSITFFRIMRSCSVIINQIRQDFDRNGHSLEQNQIRKKLIQVLVIFLMAQHCIVPSVNLLWLHTMLTFKFTNDLLLLMFAYVSSANQNNNNIYTETSPEERNVSNLTYWFIHLFKVTYSCSFLYYTSFYISFSYVLVTAAYYLLAQHCFESGITKVMESLQFDMFEGMEQYYVSGFFGCIEVLYAALFMIWSLINNKQFLMFVALYTNVYQGGKEIVNFTTSVAFVEWVNLAQFERATKNELSSHDDVCAVCLCVMKSARKTPCKHYFHGHCLRRCLKEKKLCPLCNTSLQSV